MANKNRKDSWKHAIPILTCGRSVEEFIHVLVCTEQSAEIFSHSSRLNATILFCYQILYLERSHFFVSYSFLIFVKEFLVRKRTRSLNCQDQERTFSSSLCNLRLANTKRYNNLVSRSGIIWKSPLSSFLCHQFFPIPLRVVAKAHAAFRAFRSMFRAAFYSKSSFSIATNAIA